MAVEITVVSDGGERPEGAPALADSGHEQGEGVRGGGGVPGSCWPWRVEGLRWGSAICPAGSRSLRGGCV